MDFRKALVSVPVPSKAASTWRDVLLLMTDKFEAPPVILRVEDSIIGTPDNFSASTGKAKSTKTFNIYAIVAAAMTGGMILNYSASLPPGKRRVLYADTKQREYHCNRGISRILHLVRHPADVHPDGLLLLYLRKFATKKWMDLLKEPIYRIDGICDSMHDINNPGESTNTITKLMW